MSSRQEIAVAGADKDLLDVLLGEDLSVLGVFDPKPDNVLSFGLPWLGGDDAAPAFFQDHPHVRLLLAVDPSPMRRRLYERHGPERCATFVSSGATVSARARIGPGCSVQRGVTISADVTLDAACRVNIGAQIHHDVRLGTAVTVGPAAVILGNAIVDENAYIGSAAVILPRITVGAGARIGAGAVVTRDVPAGETWVGVPARPLENKDATS